MHSFSYQKGQLFVENVPVDSLAADFGTPLYVYSQSTIEDHFRRLSSALGELDHKVCYAVKANSNLAVLKTLADLGAGFDIVSGGELFRVVRAGGDAADCTFAGVGKSAREIEDALKAGIHSFNVESEAELERINQIAAGLEMIAPVSVRVNPNVDAKTHKYISTGKSENKFGIDFERIEEVYDRASALPGIKLRGLQMHIGSQLTSAAPFEEAVRKVGPLAQKLKERHGIEFFSIGGGVGIIYQNSFLSGNSDWWADQPADERPITLDAYAATVVPLLKGLGLKILLEPGRVIVGNAGILVTRVEYVKKGGAKTFCIVDAGMNDLLRPALYQGHHEIVPVVEPTNAEATKVDVVGPICESGDFLAADRDMALPAEGDLLAVMSSGAYGFSMASNYNSRPFPAEVMVKDASARVVRERQKWEDLVRGESL